MKTVSPVSRREVTERTGSLTTLDNHQEREAERTASQIIQGPDDTYAQRSGGPTSSPHSSPIAPTLLKEIERERLRGIPLPAAVRSFMEPGFGQDFSGIRLHTSPRASELTAHLRARAFTVGQDLFFRSGEFRPQSRSGLRLIAHELAHSTQGTPSLVQRSPEGGPDVGEVVSTEASARMRLSGLVPIRVEASPGDTLHDVGRRALLNLFDDPEPSAKLSYGRADEILRSTVPIGVEGHLSPVDEHITDQGMVTFGVPRGMLESIAAELGQPLAHYTERSPSFFSLSRSQRELLQLGLEFAFAEVAGGLAVKLVTRAASRAYQGYARIRSSVAGGGFGIKSTPKKGAPPRIPKASRKTNEAESSLRGPPSEEVASIASARNAARTIELAQAGNYSMFKETQKHLLRYEGTAPQKAAFFDELLLQVARRSGNTWTHKMTATQNGHYIFIGPDVLNIRVISAEGHLYKGSLDTGVHVITGEPTLNALTRIKLDP